LIVIWFWK